MKIAVLMTITPFAQGGGEKMADDLVFHLNRYGHRAKRYDTVMWGHSARHPVRGLLNSACLQFHDVDLVIPLIPLNVRVSHPNVVPWLIGQSRVFYELYHDQDLGYACFGAEGDAIRETIIRNDSEAMKNLPKVYTISPRTKELFQKYNHVDTEVLILPLEEDGGFFCREYGDFVMYHSRIHYQKRQHLAIQAMRYTKTNVKLLLAGADNAPKYTQELRETIREHNLQDKVTLLVEHFSEEQKIDWLSRCLGGFYLGEDEDYWAIVTTEVMLSKKPVIAPLDTGATKYVVRDGITGLQPEGTPQAIAEAMDRLYLDKATARRMGEAGEKLIREISPSWETVVQTLTGEVDPS